MHQTWIKYIALHCINVPLVVVFFILSLFKITISLTLSGLEGVLKLIQKDLINTQLKLDREKSNKL